MPFNSKECVLPLPSRREMWVVGGSLSFVLTAGYICGLQKKQAKEALVEGPQVFLASTALVSRDGLRTTIKDQISGQNNNVIYVFRTECVWCSQNKLAVNFLAEQLRGRVGMIGIILDNHWPAKESYIFPVFRYDPTGSVTLPINVTPTTWITDAGFTTLQTLQGAYSSGNQQRIEQALHVKVPIVS